MDIQYPDVAIVDLCVDASHGMGLGKIRRCRAYFNRHSGDRIDWKFIAGDCGNLFCGNELAASFLKKEKAARRLLFPYSLDTPKSLYDHADSAVCIALVIGIFPLQLLRQGIDLILRFS